MIWLSSFINLTVVFFLAWFVWKRQGHGLHMVYWPAWIVKLTAGICVGAIYKYYYLTGDTLTYFRDGAVLAILGREDLTDYIRFLWNGDHMYHVLNQLDNHEPRALFLVKMTSFINLLTNDNYWITSLYFSSVSFFASWYLVTIILRRMPHLFAPVIVSFLFLPSAVFWSAGLIKESIAMSALFILSVIVFKAWRHEVPAVWEWLVMPLCIWLLWSLKYYYLAVFLPIAGASVAGRFLFDSQLLKGRSVAVKVFIWLILLLIPLISVTFVHPNFYPELFLDVIVSNYEAFHAISEAGDVIVYNDLRPTVPSIISNVPWALISGLFRPFPTDVSTVLQGLMAAENFILIALTLAALSKVSNLVNSPYRLQLLTLLVYSLTLCIFLALSTPNFGTLSRYRVGFLSFYFLLISLNNPLVTRLTRFMQRNSGHLAR